MFLKFYLSIACIFLSPVLVCPRKEDELPHVLTRVVTFLEEEEEDHSVYPSAHGEDKCNCLKEDY